MAFVWYVSLTYLVKRVFKCGPFPLVYIRQDTLHHAQSTNANILNVSYISGDQRTENNKLLTHFT